MKTLAKLFLAMGIASKFRTQYGPIEGLIWEAIVTHIFIFGWKGPPVDIDISPLCPTDNSRLVPMFNPNDCQKVLLFCPKERKFSEHFKFDFVYPELMNEQKHP